jgi:hypothetical protein
MAVTISQQAPISNRRTSIISRVVSLAAALLPVWVPTTDYGVMQGEYWAARAAQQGTFTHI